MLDLTDKLDDRYKTELQKLIADRRSNGKLHWDYIFQLHQLLLAVAINVWDYPSRLDKYDMDFIMNKNDIKEGKNYILLDAVVSFIFNNEKKRHKPIEYKLNAKPIQQFNKRLNDLIVYSFQTYPRETLFIQSTSWTNQKRLPVKDTTITNWIIDLVPTKNLGVGTFRSSFVSYWYNKSNNRDKKVMEVRMRTSRQELERAYLKFYNTPDSLVQVKVEPSDDLINRANSGKANNPIQVDNSSRNQQIQQNRDIPVNIPLEKRKEMTLQERKRLNSKKWYAKNKVKHLDFINKNGKKPEEIKKRMARELNNGLLKWDSVRESTRQKYNLKYENGVYL